MGTIYQIPLSINVQLLQFYSLLSSQEKIANKTETCIPTCGFLGDGRWFPPFLRNLLPPTSGQKMLPDYMVSEFRNHNTNLHCQENLTLFSWR
jgi:hypothetical protein